MDRIYHVNPKTGSAGRCQAKVLCPFGGPENHYTSREAARDAYEQNQENFAVNPKITTKLLAQKIIRKENLDYDYIAKELEYIKTWEKPWTDEEKTNLSSLVELNELLEAKPFTAKNLAEAQRIHGEMIPPKAEKKSGSAYDGTDNSWRARDRKIIDLAADLITRKQGDQLKFKEKLEPLENKELLGLQAAQEAALKEANYPVKEARPYIGAVEPFLQESIARIGRGDSPPEFALEQQTATLLPPRERLLTKLHKDSATYDQRLYLATVFPVRELKEEMEKVSITDVSVSVLSNGRETGNIYSLITPEGKVQAFTVYEHRNSDSIIINGKSDWDGKGLPYATDSKYGYFAEISARDNRTAARTLAYFMANAQRGTLESDEELVAKAPKVDWLNILSDRIPGFKSWAEKQGEKITKPEDESDEDTLNRLDF